jgi:hypothetical protein
LTRHWFKFAKKKKKKKKNKNNKNINKERKERKGGKKKERGKELSHFSFPLSALRKRMNELL